MLDHSEHSSLNFHELRDLIPPRLFQRNSVRSVSFLLRDLTMAIALAFTVSMCDSALISLQCSTAPRIVLRASIWLTYWWFQGLIFTGIWVIGHECGHNSFSPSRMFSDVVGFICHTALWTPYFSWKFTHQSHHRHHASMEKDEHWIPKTRSELNIPCGLDTGHTHNCFDDTPILTVFRLLFQQLLGFPAYLLANISGQRQFPLGTSHFNPFSTALFKFPQRKYVIISDIGIVLNAYAVYSCAARMGTLPVLKLYGLPCIAVSHWVTMIVFLQHTDPRLPHYRKKAWNFRVGALSTMDRDFLGWQGRFFLHNIAHFHTIHHLFPSIPFYHAEEATQIFRQTFPHEYHSSSEPVFKCLWENYNSCQFVEDEGEVLYYKDRLGRNAIIE